MDSYTSLVEIHVALEHEGVPILLITAKLIAIDGTSYTTGSKPNVDGGLTG